MIKVFLVVVVLGAGPEGSDKVSKLNYMMKLDTCRQSGAVLAAELMKQAANGRTLIWYCEAAGASIGPAGE